jgi:hypothetical protein
MDPTLQRILFGGGLARLNPTYTYVGGSKQRLGQGPGYYNFNKPYGLLLRNLLRSRAAFTMLTLGDSTLVGISDVSLKSQSVPDRLAAFLSANGHPAAADSFMGDANFANTTNYLAYNSLMNNFTAGWSVGAVESLGGKAFTNTSNTTGAINFVPANPSTGLDVLTIGVAHSYKVRFGGVDQQTITPAAQPQKNHVDWENAGTLAAFLRVSGTCFICGAVARNANSPRIDILNAGRSGSGSAFWSDNSSTARALNCLPVMGAEVVLINQMIGDWGDGGSLTEAQVKTNKKVYIDKILAYGGIPFLVVPHPTPTSIASAARQASYSDIDYELSDEYGFALMDLHALMGNDYQNLVNAGFTWDVSSHPNGAAYQYFANYIGSGLLQLAA